MKKGVPKIPSPQGSHNSNRLCLSQGFGDSQATEPHIPPHRSPGPARPAPPLPPLPLRPAATPERPQPALPGAPPSLPLPLPPRPALPAPRCTHPTAPALHASALGLSPGTPEDPSEAALAARSPPDAPQPAAALPTPAASPAPLPLRVGRPRPSPAAGEKKAGFGAGCSREQRERRGRSAGAGTGTGTGAGAGAGPSVLPPGRRASGASCVIALRRREDPPAVMVQLGECARARPAGPGPGPARSPPRALFTGSRLLKSYRGGHVVIRFALGGCANRPFFRIVAAHSRRARDGKYLEQLGCLDPLPNAHGERVAGLNLERLRHWLGCGAQLSRPAEKLLGRPGGGVLGGGEADGSPRLTGCVSLQVWRGSCRSTP